MGLPSMRPTGWFQVAWSADLEVGDVMALHYFGEELVAFRDLDGVVRVLDAHCQHMGADLSHGGCVVEGGIQCPFHGWVWSGDDGRNVRIPYEQHADVARRVRCWPTTERNECIYVWHDLRHRAPSWPAPDAWGGLDDRIGRHWFRPLGPDEKQFFGGVTVHPQIVVESSVDVSTTDSCTRCRSARPCSLRPQTTRAGMPPSASVPGTPSKYVGMGSV